MGIVARGPVTFAGAGLFIVLCDKLLFSLNKTFRAAFNTVQMKGDKGEGLINLIVYASDSDFKTDDEFVDINLTDKGVVFTDNYNPADYFTVGVMEKWRAKQLSNLTEDFML